MNESMRADLMHKTGLHVTKAYIERDRSGKAVGLSRASLSGRLVEFSGQGNLANLTLACGLVLDAQREGETAAWITGKESTFYPPDAARTGSIYRPSRCFAVPTETPLPVRRTGLPVPGPSGF